MWNYIILIFLFAQRTRSVHTSATVELAIFCDFEFCEHFQHNETKIREFWAFRIYDTNLRFKTLPSVVINFVVTSLTTIKSKSDQDFIEQQRDNTGSVSIENVLYEFKTFINDSLTNKFPAYDIALLALGANTNDYTSRAYPNSACDLIHNLAVVRFAKDDDWWSSCGSLEFGLSTVLGARADSHYSSKCHDGKYIKGGECSKNHFFFSSCSNDAIFDDIQYASCLHRIDSKILSIFDVQELNVQPPSIREQCVLITNNSKVWVNASDKNLCISTICYSGSETRPNNERIIYPIDNSPCDTNKSCFRGRCIQNGFQIRHTISLKCLHSSNIFTSDDNLHLQDCPEVPIALDRFMIFRKDDNAVILATAYSSVNASENSDKCVLYDVTSNLVRYQNCYQISPDQTYKFEWELLGMGNNTIIRHKKSQLCLGSPENDTVVMEKCSSENKNMVWTFHETKEPSTSVFLNSELSPNSAENTKTTTSFNGVYIDGTTLNVSSINSVNSNLICEDYSWVYLGFGAFLIVTVIL